MKNRKNLFSVVILLTSFIPALSFSADGSAARYNNIFDTSKQGQLPNGWVVDETYSGRSSNKPRKLASWVVMENSNGPSGKNILAIKKINDSSGSAFNIIYTNRVKFLNGEIKVKVRANSGVIDQGGGPIWRFKDKNNYYVARYNPLEGNFRVYYVKNGRRIQLQSAGNIGIKKGEWFTIKIMHKGNHIVGWLNGKKLLDLEDNTHKTTGGVGLWTKADAVSAFDDFSVNLL